MWLLKINYLWRKDDGTENFDEEPDLKFDNPQDAYDKAKYMAMEEARNCSMNNDAYISLKFYEDEQCANVDCEGAYAVIDLVYTYENNSVCRYIVTEE